MASISVALPLTRDSADGFTMNKTLRATIKQNFKMLILTSPGERVMEPEFGVGLRNFLFQNFDESTFYDIENAIKLQTKAYMPVIKIVNIDFGVERKDQNLLGLTIVYDIPSIASAETLQITI
jgi:phage baseplate assembly protein W